MESSSAQKESMIIPLSKGLTLLLSILGMAGVAEGLKDCVIGASEACEIKPELGTALVSVSMTGASLVLVLVSTFKIQGLDVKTLKQAGLSICGGFIMSFSVYFGSKALGTVSKYGLPAKAKQKKFTTFLYFCMLVAEIISIFGLILSNIAFGEAKNK